MERLDATQLGGTTCEHARELVSCLLDPLGVTASLVRCTNNDRQ